jgi:hypothetical protein
MGYKTKWRDYRKRGILFLMVFLTFFATVPLIGVPLEYLLKTEIPVYFVAISWMIAFVVTGWRLAYWKCPRCNNWFFAKGLLGFYCNPLARRCLHCGLPMWADQDTDKNKPSNKALKRDAAKDGRAP